MQSNWLEIVSVGIQGGLLLIVANLAHKIGKYETKIDTMWGWWVKNHGMNQGE